MLSEGPLQYNTSSRNDPIPPAKTQSVQNKYKRTITKKPDTQDKEPSSLKRRKPPLSVKIDLSDKQEDRSRNCL